MPIGIALDLRQIVRREGLVLAVFRPRLPVAEAEGAVLPGLVVVADALTVDVIEAFLSSFPAR